LLIYIYIEKQVGKFFVSRNLHEHVFIIRKKMLRFILTIILTDNLIGYGI